MHTKQNHPAIPMTVVKSSQIEAIGYDAGSKTLAVRFKGGSVYHYDDVPAEVHAALAKAESVGSHFHANVKKAGFQYRKVS